MELLLDRGLPRSTASLLREKGLDALHVGEIDMAAAADQAIIEHARANGYSIVTLDADFHSLLALAEASGPSVVRLRIQRLKAPEAGNLIWTLLERIGHELDVCWFSVKWIAGVPR
jgi:predicted nuclease of predicted toxin-antitoxin system